MNQNSSVRKLVRCGVVAAIYVVLCLALQPLSYGAVQVRVAEALCLLPVFGTEYILGVVLGCFLANLLGSTIVDVIFGTLATLLACLVTYRLRNIRFKGLALAASLPPVLFNAVIIGIEIAVMFPDPSSSAPIWLACITNGISVGIGELISCTVLGVLLVKIIESNTALSQILSGFAAGGPHAAKWYDFLGLERHPDGRCGFYPRVPELDAGKPRLPAAVRSGPVPGAVPLPH